MRRRRRKSAGPRSGASGVPRTILTPSFMTIEPCDMARFPAGRRWPSLAGKQYAAAPIRLLRRSARADAAAAAAGENQGFPAASARRPSRGSALRGADLVVAALAFLEDDQPLALCVREQLGKVAVPVGALGEIGVYALQSFLDDRAPYGVVLLLEGRHGRRQPLKRLALLL